MRATQQGTRERQARLRGAILALVGRQQLTEEEIISELDHFASPARVKRQIAHLVGRSHITRVDRPDGTVVYEHWDLTMVRVRRHANKPRAYPHVRREPRKLA